MRKLLGSNCLLVFISLLCANPRAWADTLEFVNGQTMHTQEINPQETAKNFQYGLVKINYTSLAVTNLKMDLNNGSQILPSDLFAGEAHAAILPVNQNILTAADNAHQTLLTALRFEDIKPYLTTQAYEDLVEKRGQGSRELLILQILKASVPKQIELIEVQTTGDLAWVLARGKINGRDFWGTLALARQEGQWKLSQETWYGNPNNPLFIKSTREPQDFLDKPNNPPSKEFVTWAANAGRPKTTLPLEYGRIGTPKNSFCFFFFLNPKKQNTKDNKDFEPLIKAAPSPDMHIIWPSNFRHDPRTYKNYHEDDFDVSVASEKDGYYPNKMNLRLPNGKPREVYVGLLISF